ncbi:hypothetical protein HYQ46_008823, partial [Verticillium longisporum]
MIVRGRRDGVAVVDSERFKVRFGQVFVNSPCGRIQDEIQARKTGGRISDKMETGKKGHGGGRGGPAAIDPTSHLSLTLGTHSTLNLFVAHQP